MLANKTVILTFCKAVIVALAKPRFGLLNAHLLEHVCHPGVDIFSFIV